MTNNNFDSKAFRAALGTFTTGVTIITATAQDGTRVGITANSFNSVSLDPPLVLWSLAKSANSLPVFTETKHWNVHVLSVEQESLSGRFASRGEDKFAGIELDDGLTDAPLLPGCTARFQCRTAFIHDGGDHLIFIGEVLRFDHNDLPPLVFQSGQYALTARKPREEIRLTRAEPPPECSYTEDLLGYLLGRAHFQMVNRLKGLLDEQHLAQEQFFILSVLCIRDRLTLDDINEYIAYTGYTVDLNDMEVLITGGHVVIEDGRYRLTADGREASLHQIAQAKAIEEELVEALGPGDAMALKLLLKRLIERTDPGLPDLWAVSN
ncbi:flavin reductase family protein [Marinobacterium sediminicola]|uniref:3-hydroxy-9,10-secoandrosta-1,3,5(10)-triene-9,17-dione monooxygenase reductase component n=1 Tax=Marinobacterium sediminicola TaxID=518898 RepID=A0ABY1S438_9GAMM|nr:flavin reductase family protein [Marinobacterium sediminicola]ULG70131.1 flavin reductase family protein [Marinobacterium sediminicola]SMR78406.1 3-hydroxy-9,10-secoandrosta-1,3,5(10)-triene-9,17-dione monooxygenase reductase component [Marinobacterium sediminicola]